MVSDLSGEQLLHGLIGGQVDRSLLFPRHEGIPMTTQVHNARVNGQRHDMNLVKLIDSFGSEDRCREHLKHLRWPDGVRCLRCNSASVSWISTRKQFDCNSCRYRFSTTAGTVFHDSHLPLWKWFLATYMMC